MIKKDFFFSLKYLCLNLKFKNNNTKKYRLIIYVEEDEYNNELFKSNEKIKQAISTQTKPFIRKLTYSKINESLNVKIDFIIVS